MATTTVIDFVQGDDLPTITAFLRDKNTAKVGAVLDPDNQDTWAPIGLLGCIVQVQIAEKGGLVVDTFDASVIDVDTARILLPIPADAAFAQQPGVYQAEITIKFPTRNQQTVYELLQIKVRERLQIA